MAMFAGLNTMIRGIYVNQTALNTTGHNIVNADTEGYSRQSVNVITTVLLTISVIATIFSGYNYLKDGKELFKEN